MACALQATQRFLFCFGDETFPRSWFSFIKPASHCAIIKESEGSQLVVQSDEICSDYFPPIVSVPLPDRRTKSNIGNRKLPPIVGPKSDMADYRRLPPIIIFPDTSSPTARFVIRFSIRPSDPPISRAMGRRL